MKNPITKVVFRKWKGTQDILALFPEEMEGPHFCSSFEHVGQHGSANYAACIARTKPATPAEYAGTKRELESAPYHYNLKVIRRYVRSARPLTAYASFNRFEFKVPIAAIPDCTRPGCAADDDVAHWQKQIDLSHIPDDQLAAELEEYGAWNAEELADRDQNEKRIIWIACGNLNEEKATRP